MMTRFGERLKKLRNDRKITQKQLAHDLNIPESTIRRLETQDGTPIKERITEFAIYFGVTTDFLLGHEELQIKEAREEYFGDEEAMQAAEIFSRIPIESRKNLLNFMEGMAKKKK